MNLILFCFLNISFFIEFINTERIWSHEYAELNSKNISEDSTEFWLNVSSEVLQISRDWSLRKFSEWQNSKEKLVNGTISNDCLAVIDHVLMNLLSDEQWTAEIVDSIGGLPSGILSMTQTSLGDFDQCLSIHDTFQNKPFVGKYCLATISIPRKSFFKQIPFNQTQLPVKWFGDFIRKFYDNDNWFYSAIGVCFPSICKPSEIRSAIQAHFPIVNNFDFNVTFCQSVEEPTVLDPRNWIGIVIIAVPWCFIIIGTFMELFLSYKPKSFLGKSLFGFSIISNTKYLFHISNDSKKNEEFQFVHGVRALASIFIVIAHSAGLIFTAHQLRISAFARFPDDMIEKSKRIVAQPFYNGALMVIIFFVMSGMFLARSALSKGRVKINFFSYVIFRWLRFAPSLIGLIGLNHVAEYFGSGPLFHHDLVWPTISHCYENWIQNLLFISNYEEITEMCNVQTWYLSSEMQMHILAFVLIVFYARSSRLTYLTSILFVLFSFCVVTLISGSGFIKINIIQSIMYPANPPPSLLSRYFFFSPLLNITSYYLGFILGIFLLEKRRDRLSPLSVRIIWILVLIILIGSPFSSYFKSQDVQAQWNRNGWEAGIEFVTGVLAWSMAITWTMWRFILNPKNPAARFFAAKFWQPMSRLSFSLYLSHILVIWFNVYQIRNIISLGGDTEIFKMISVAIIEGYALAIFIYVTFEAPSVNILRLMMPSKNKEKNPESTESLQDMKMEVNANLR